MRHGRIGHEPGNRHHHGNEQRRVGESGHPHHRDRVARPHHDGHNHQRTHEHFGQASDGFEQSHCQTLARLAALGRQHRNTIHHSWPHDGVEHAPRDGDHAHHGKGRNGDEQHQIGGEPPAEAPEQNGAHLETVVDPAGRHIEKHRQAQIAHEQAELGRRDVQHLLQRNHQRALETLEGAIDDLARHDDGEE